MITFCLLPVYFVVVIWIIRRVFIWMKNLHSVGKHPAIKTIVAVVYTVLALTPVIAFFCPVGKVKHVFSMIGNYMLGIMLYSLLVVILAEIVLLVSRKKSGREDSIFYNKRSVKIVVGIISIVLIATMSLVGMYSANNLVKTTYDVHVSKSVASGKSMKIALIADTHMGYNIGCKHIQKMADMINEMNADLVIFAGDIFDNSYDALDDPDRLIEIYKSIKSKYGIYACYGNHDINEKILAGFTLGSDEKKVSDPRMDEFLDKAGIKLLKDEYTLLNNEIYLYGRPDYMNPGRDVDVRKTPAEVTEGMDKTKPIFVMDHEPKELAELADAGVDVDFCGHTHDGQTFPGCVLTNIMWENACGYIKKGNMHNIVTSGVGVFGPMMRLGTKAEVCEVNITFD